MKKILVITVIVLTTCFTAFSLTGKNKTVKVETSTVKGNVESTNAKLATAD